MKTRKQNRRPVSAQGACRLASGAQWSVVLEDLTTDGCRIADPNRTLAQGQRVQIVVVRGAPHRAEVCWWRKGEAGLEFAQPLPDDLLGSLRDNAPEPLAARHTSSTARYC